MLAFGKFSQLLQTHKYQIFYIMPKDLALDNAGLLQQSFLQLLWLNKAAQIFDHIAHVFAVLPQVLHSTLEIFIRICLQICLTTILYPLAGFPSFERLSMDSFLASRSFTQSQPILDSFGYFDLSGTHLSAHELNTKILPCIWLGSGEEGIKGTGAFFHLPPEGGKLPTFACFLHLIIE